jgi:hypothetical protein
MRLRRNRGTEEQLVLLIQEELDRTPAGEREKLLGYIERWLDRHFENLLEGWTPQTGVVQ